MTDYQNFTSLSPELERQFVPFERRTVESGKKAWTVGVSSAIAFGIITIIIVFSFPPPENPHADAPGGFGADVSGEEATPAEAAPSAEEAAEPDATEPATEEAAAGETAAGEAEAAGEGEAEAETPEPAKPKGATKAPPTALTGE